VAASSSNRRPIFRAGEDDRHFNFNTFQYIAITVDEAVLHVMPLLKNGVTPEKETILKVLHQVAEHRGSDRWRLQDNPQFALFDEAPRLSRPG
jgi:hypothetical protein